MAERRSAPSCTPTLLNVKQVGARAQIDEIARALALTVLNTIGEIKVLRRHVTTAPWPNRFTLQNVERSGTI